MIGQYIKTLAATTDEVYSLVCKVSSVDRPARTCDVAPLNGGADLFGVRLQAEQGGNFGAVLFPKVGSWVIITFLGKNDAYVAATSEVETAELRVANQTMRLEASGLSLQSASADFKEQLDKLMGVVDDLLTTLQTFTVATNAGPSVAVMPPTISNLLKHQLDLGLVKQALGTILK